MKLLELRYRKLPIVDKIVAIADEVAMGGNEYAAKLFKKYGIDPYASPEEVRREVTIMDEFKIMQMYRALIGGK